MIALDAHTKVYLAQGHTDMRCQIHGLAAWVEDVLQADPFSSLLFVFCNRARDKIRVLVWYRNGFWLLYWRLEKQRFWWPPGTDQGAMEFSVRELQWLLEGLDPTTVQDHRKAPFFSALVYDFAALLGRFEYTFGHARSRPEAACRRRATARPGRQTASAGGAAGKDRT
ncbi:MAG: IS66 family insertion sequence element accessory protein TnpB [Pirellulaceae bacterium]